MRETIFYIVVTIVCMILSPLSIPLAYCITAKYANQASILIVIMFWLILFISIFAIIRARGKIMQTPLGAYLN
jgi:hypothetical protein